MDSVVTTTHPNPARPEQLSTRIIFLIAGFGAAAWAPLVPFAKARTGIGDGELGLLLLCLGMGSFVAMPLAGALAARFGCRRVLTGAALVICLALPFLATVSSPRLLIAALFVFGAGLGSFDVTINIQAVIVERASGRSMMSGFHGLYSVGGIVGAAGVTAFLGAGASPLVATLCVVVCLLVALAYSAPNMLSYGTKREGPAFAFPHGAVLFIGLLCFVAFLAEGAMLDWSAVFLTSVHAMKPSLAGLGYAAFASTMTIGRLTGDRIVQRLGGSVVIGVGGLLAAGGFTLATLVPSWQVALIGYALVGVGCSNIVPVLFTTVGRQNVMPESVAIPAIATLGFGGVLVGPAAIGFVAHAINLPAAFLILAVLLIGVAAGGQRLRV
jgi:predicted MFS family arabinose efflux permease